MKELELRAMQLKAQRLLDAQAVTAEPILERMFAAGFTEKEIQDVVYVGTLTGTITIVDVILNP